MPGVITSRSLMNGAAVSGPHHQPDRAQTARALAARVVRRRGAQQRRTILGSLRWLVVFLLVMNLCATSGASSALATTRTHPAQGVAGAEPLAPDDLSRVFEQARVFWSSVLPQGQGLAATNAPPTRERTSVDQGQLTAAVAQAAAEWEAAGADTRGIRVVIGSLPGRQLGFTSGRTVTIDDDAAGWGWDRMSLITVVRHEIGHAVGLLTLPARSYGTDVELEGLLGLGSSAKAGVIFDQYKADDYKFVTLDRSAGVASIGHVFHGRLVVDASFAVSLPSGDVAFKVSFSGTTVTVSVGGVVLGSYAYNSDVVDGGIGALVAAGQASFEDVHVFVGTRLVNAVDITPPQLTLPRDVTVQIPWGQAAVFVSDAILGTASATDNTVLDSLVRTGVPAGNLFPLGVTEIWWTATDVFGNVARGVQTVTATPPLPAVSVTVTDPAGAETGSDPVVFTVRRTDTTLPVSITLAWGGTATWGVDYAVQASGGALPTDGRTLTLAAGVASATLRVAPMDDSL